MKVTYKRYANGDRVETADAFGLNAFGAPRWFSAYDFYLDGVKVGYVTRAEDGPWNAYIDRDDDPRYVRAMASSSTRSEAVARVVRLSNNRAGL